MPAAEFPVGEFPVGEFPPGFFHRGDPSADERFYGQPRLVTHLDAAAIAAVGALYDELSIRGDVLDLMGSWVSHFTSAPTRLTVLGMNAAELAENRQASETVVHDLNASPRLPFADASFDDVVCCASVDYLVEPVAVFREVARVLRPGGRLVCTFSNRCFPTKAIRGWLESTDDERCAIVVRYFALAHGYDEAVVETRVPASPTRWGDPLFAVWSRSVHSTP